jgi:hypothetical protein
MRHTAFRPVFFIVPSHAPIARVRAQILLLKQHIVIACLPAESNISGLLQKAFVSLSCSLQILRLFDDFCAKTHVR